MNPYIKSNIDEFFKSVWNLLLQIQGCRNSFWGYFCWREIFKQISTIAHLQISRWQNVLRKINFSVLLKHVKTKYFCILFTRKQVFLITVVVGGIVILETVFIKNWSYKTFNELSLILMYVATPCIFISLALILLFILNRSWYVNVIRLFTTFITETYC